MLTNSDMQMVAAGCPTVSIVPFPTDIATGVITESQKNFQSELDNLGTVIGEAMLTTRKCSVGGDPEEIYVVDSEDHLLGANTMMQKIILQHPVMREIYNERQFYGDSVIMEETTGVHNNTYVEFFDGMVITQEDGSMRATEFYSSEPIVKRNIYAKLAAAATHRFIDELAMTDDDYKPDEMIGFDADEL